MAGANAGHAPGPGLRAPAARALGLQWGRVKRGCRWDMVEPSSRSQGITISPGSAGLWPSRCLSGPPSWQPAWTETSRLTEGSLTPMEKYLDRKFRPSEGFLLWETNSASAWSHPHPSGVQRSAVKFTSPMPQGCRLPRS